MNKTKAKIKNIIERYLRKSMFSGILFKNKPIILQDVYGMRFVLYPWTHEPLEKLISKRHLIGEYNAIKKIIKPNDTIIDIGANIGTHSIFMSRIIGNQGKIYAFEPINDTYWELKENLALNKIENTETILAAAKDIDGKQTMNIFPQDFSAWNSFGKPDTNESKIIGKTEVKTIKLDSFMIEKNINKIDFLKIDAEGSEKDVFIGSEQILKEKIAKTISFEVSKLPLQANNVTGKELFDIVIKNGYKVYSFDNKIKKFIGPITVPDDSIQCENYYASVNDLNKI